MAEFYTKQQVDELATIIGTRIKNHSSAGQENAFTDNHKTTLEALQGLAPATSIESFLDAFNAAMLGITPGTE